MSFIRNNLFPEKFYPTLNVPEYEHIIKNNRDFYGAIKLAENYSKLFHWQFNLNIPVSKEEIEQKAMGWLWESLSYKPENVNINEAINLKQFFSRFTKISCPYLFSDNAKTLLAALKENKSIEALDFSMPIPDNYSDNFNYLNENFSDYILTSTTLKKIDLCNTSNQRYKLQTSDISYLAKGIKTNVSVEKIFLRNQNVGNEGLSLLLEAIAGNPNTKISTLNLIQASIGDEGATALIQFLRKNTSLQTVYLTEVNGDQNTNTVSPALASEIKKLLKSNKDLNTEINKYQTESYIPTISSNKNLLFALKDPAEVIQSAIIKEEKSFGFK